jgi:hypothetical protein
MVVMARIAKVVTCPASWKEKGISNGDSLVLDKIVNQRHYFIHLKTDKTVFISLCTDGSGKGYSSGVKRVEWIN